MIIDVTQWTNKEVPAELKIGAFTFEREQTGRVVLHVDVDSGLYPMRLTEKQAEILTQWLLAYESTERVQ